MASVRITRTMAEKAASKMCNAAFYTKVKEAEKRLQEYAESLVHKYIPQPVLAVFNEYPHCFQGNKAIQFKREGNEGGTIYEYISFDVPTTSGYYTNVQITYEHYAQLEKYETAVKQVRRDADEFQRQTIDALMALRTSSRVAEAFPEALQYLDISTAPNLPAPQFQQLRNIMQNVTTKQETDNEQSQ